MLERLYRQVTLYLTRLLFGESDALRRIGMPGMPNASPTWFRVAGFFARFAFLRLVRCRWRHFDRIPAEGVIIASNHLSSADPAMVASALYPRSPRYMAKLELFQKRPVIGYLFALSGAFPVRRGSADRSALREAERLLAQGAVVGMFPEGHRSDTGALMHAHPGTALIALRTGAPVVPIAIVGSERMRGGWRGLLARPEITLTAGRPFTLGGGGPVTKRAVADAHDELMGRIAALLPPQYRGVYAEHAAQFTEQAAGRAAAPPARAADGQTGDRP